jgi:hypothetical protein
MSSLGFMDFVEVRKTKERGRVLSIKEDDVEIVISDTKGRRTEFYKRRQLRRIPLEELL